MSIFIGRIQFYSEFNDRNNFPIFIFLQKWLICQKKDMYLKNVLNFFFLNVFLVPILRKFFLHTFQITHFCQKKYENYFRQNIFFSEFFLIFLMSSETYFDLIASKSEAKLNLPQFIFNLIIYSDILIHFLNFFLHIAHILFQYRGRGSACRQPGINRIVLLY